MKGLEIVNDINNANFLTHGGKFHKKQGNTKDLIIRSSSAE